jgi:hypothetical protein
MFKTWGIKLYAPEGGEGGSGEAAPEAASANGIAPAHDESTPGDRGEEQPAAKPERPEWFPEEFWDADKGEGKTEDLAKSYLDTKKKVTMRTGDLEKKLKEELEQSRLSARPESPDKYELRLPEGIPEDAWEWHAEDPLIKTAQEFAHERGFSQDEFDNLVSMYVQAEMSKIPDIAAEVKRLGEKGPERAERIDNWLSANVSKGAYAALSSVTNKAEVLIALEELMQKAGAPAFVVGNDLQTGDQEVLTDTLVRTWMADPKYYDPGS